MGINHTYHAGGSYTIRTDDADPYLQERRVAYTARAEAAVEVVRRRGGPPPRPARARRPCLVSRRDTDRVRARLRDALTIPPMMPASTCHVLARADARPALASVMGQAARQPFRRAAWPRSYFEAVAIGGMLFCEEARSDADAAQAAREAG